MGGERREWVGEGKPRLRDNAPSPDWPGPALGANLDQRPSKRSHAPGSAGTRAVLEAEGSPGFGKTGSVEHSVTGFLV